VDCKPYLGKPSPSKHAAVAQHDVPLEPPKYWASLCTRVYHRYRHIYRLPVKILLATHVVKYTVKLRSSYSVHSSRCSVMCGITVYTRDLIPKYWASLCTRVYHRYRHIYRLPVKILLATH
jgi:alpha-glucuronidase